MLALAHNYERLKQVPSDKTNGGGPTDIGDCYLRSTLSSHALANCTKACPPDAIAEHGQVVRGVPMDAAERASETARHDGPAPWSVTARGITRDPNQTRKAMTGPEEKTSIAERSLDSEAFHQHSPNRARKSVGNLLYYR